MMEKSKIEMCKDCLCDKCSYNAENSAEGLCLNCKVCRKNNYAFFATFCNQHKEYEEKEECCDFCKNKDDDTLWEAGGAHEFRLHQNGLYYYNENTGWEGMLIEFCPKCGRKL